MLKLFLWLRYLHKRRIVFLSIGAVALSAGLLIIVASLFNGFINALENSAVDTIGDIVISPPQRFPKYSELIKRLDSISNVKASTATLMGHGLIHLGKGNVRRVIISGIDPATQEQVNGFSRFLITAKAKKGGFSFAVPGQPDGTGGIVGIGVIASPDEKTDEYNLAEIEKMAGQQAVLITAGQLDKRNGENESADENRDFDSRFKIKNLPFTIEDVAFTGVSDIDTDFVYIPIDALQKELYPDETQKVAKQIQIRLKPGGDAEAVIGQARGVWGNFAKQELGWSETLINKTIITTTKEMQREWIAELRKQMGVLMLIFGVVSLSVVILVFCIFYMIVITRLKDIAIIKSCGATNRSVASIFVGFGTFIGMIGSVLGVIFSVIVIKNINIIERWISNITGIKLWKSSVYLFSRIPSEVDWHAVGPIVACAIAAAALGALIPAVIAIKTMPIKILRYE